jgi:DNA-binding response OmpR family regulator
MLASRSELSPTSIPMPLLPNDEIYEFGPFRLSTLSWSLEYKGSLVHLPKLEFLLLLTFLRHPNSFLTKSSFVPHVWPDEENASYRALQEHIYRLNKKLKIGVSRTRFIQFVRGQGYRFDCVVRRLGSGNLA